MPVQQLKFNSFNSQKVVRQKNKGGGGGTFSYSLLHSSSRNATVKELLKSSIISYVKNETCTFFWLTVYSNLDLSNDFADARRE